MGDWLRWRVRRWLGIDADALEMSAALIRLRLLERTVARLPTEELVRALVTGKPTDRHVSAAQRVPLGRTHQKRRGDPS